MLINIGRDYAHTVYHETGHYLNRLWGIEIAKAMGKDLTLPLTEVMSMQSVKEIENQELRTFVENFRTLNNSLQDSGDLRNDYTRDFDEVFARFVDKFTRWVGKTSGYSFNTDSWMDYGDKFTVKQFTDFEIFLFFSQIIFNQIYFFGKK